LPCAAEDSAGQFTRTVRPFLEKHCIDCHSGDEPEGDVDLSRLTADMSDEKDAIVWGEAVRQLLLGQMPPEDEARPDRDQAERVLKSIDLALVQSGYESTMQGLMTHPSFGNHIDHDALFNGKIQGPAYSPSRLWRRNGYNANVGSFSVPVRVGVRDYAGEGYVDEPTLNSLVGSISAMLADEFEGQLITRGKQKGKRKGAGRKVYTDYLESDQPTQAQAAAALNYCFGDAMERDPSPAELARYLAFLERNVAKGGRKAGLKSTLTAIYLTPEAIFRMELGLGAVASDGRRMLSPDELYLAISFAFGDAPFRASKAYSADHIENIYSNGGLKTREDVARAVRYILEDDAIEKPRIYRFFHEFFSFQEAETIFKDAKTSYSQHKYMMSDAEAFIQRILDKDERVFEELLTNSQYPLTVIRSKKKYMWPMLTYSYNLPKQEIAQIGQRYAEDVAQAEQAHVGKGAPKIDPPVKDFAGLRAGMLCHPTWLFAWSTNIENQPVQRGKWMLEHLLAGTIPEVPITVQAQVPEDPHRTLRQRYVQTRENQYCWSCHKKMNPLGMTLENFDAMGKFRTTEANKPVDATATFDGAGIPALDGRGLKVANAVELMDVLAREPRVRQSIIRHAFRYWMGRNEMLSDSPTLIAADKAYLESNGSFNAVLAALLTSDSFLYRK
jgi:hypothetical protein